MQERDVKEKGMRQKNEKNKARVGHKATGGEQTKECKKRKKGGLRGGRKTKKGLRWKKKSVNEGKMDGKKTPLQRGRTPQKGRTKGKGFRHLT